MADLVSVVVPIYNSERYIYECLSSILRQSYNKIEVIIIDDGSTDNSYELCKKISLRDSRVKIYRQKNLGVSAARNNGILHSNGKYVMFVDSDDWLDPNFLQNILDDEYDLDVSTNKKNIICKAMPIENDIQNYCFSKEMYKFFLGPVCKIYRMDIIKRENIAFRTDMNFGEDTMFNIDYLRYAKKVKIIVSDGYHIRKRSGSLSRRYVKNVYWQMMMLLDKIIDEKLGIDMENFWRIRCAKQVIIIDSRGPYTDFKKDMLSVKRSMLKGVNVSNVMTRKDMVILHLLDSEKYLVLYLLCKIMQKL